MVIDITISPALQAWIASRSDPGEPPLRIRYLGAGRSRIEREGGADLSESEAAHVRGLLAAHAAEPISTYPKKDS